MRGLWGGVKGGCEVVVGVEAGLEPRRNRCLMLRTGQEGDGTTLDGEQSLGGILWGKATAGTPKAAGGAVLKHLRRVLGGHPTDRAKRPHMLRTPNQGNPELIHQQKRHRLRPRRVEERLAGIAANCRPAGWCVPLHVIGVVWGHPQLVNTAPDRKGMGGHSGLGSTHAPDRAAILWCCRDTNCRHIHGAATPTGESRSDGKLREKDDQAQIADDASAPVSLASQGR